MLPPVTADRFRDPARLPGTSRSNDVVLSAAMRRPAWVAAVLFLLLALVAVPAFFVFLFGALGNDRR